MILAVTLMLSEPVIQTLPPPIEVASPATEWRCDFVDSVGSSFSLSGIFPEAPIGWNPNHGMPAEVKGNGPEDFIGTHEVKPFSSDQEYRRYYMVARAPANGHYNLMFVLLRNDDGVATIDRFTRDSSGESGTMSSFATGNCSANFDVGKSKETDQK